MPVVVFAVLFGLSTDYEVFSMSRIREAFDAHGDPEAAIVNGVTSTARVIASAALIMASVFLAFVTNPSALVKMIGLPLGVGILIDAFLIRLTINPRDHADVRKVGVVHARLAESHSSEHSHRCRATVSG